jgi:hypothetical protein
VTVVEVAIGPAAVFRVAAVHAPTIRTSVQPEAIVCTNRLGTDRLRTGASWRGCTSGGPR